MWLVCSWLSRSGQPIACIVLPGFCGELSQIASSSTFIMGAADVATYVWNQIMAIPRGRASTLDTWHLHLCSYASSSSHIRTTS